MSGLDESEKYPRLALIGKTGAGKSSLYNALVEGDYQRVGVTPTTRESQSIKWKTGEHTTVLVDMPGLKEAGKAEDLQDGLIDQLTKAHMALLVVGFPDRALEFEKELVQQVSRVEPDMPILVLASRVDAVARSFDNSSFDPTAPTTAAERDVADWLEYLKETLAGAGATDVIACAAGESANDTERQYNLDGVDEAIQELLPEAAKLNYLHRTRLLASKEEKASLIISTAAGSAAAAAAVPVPIADAVVISGIQASMIVSLAKLYELELTWSTAGGLATSAMAGVAGPMAVQQLSKFIPFAGSVIGPAFAGVVTLSIGHTFKSFFYEGNFNPTPEEIKSKVKKAYKRNKAKKDEFK